MDLLKPVDISKYPLQNIKWSSEPIKQGIKELLFQENTLEEIFFGYQKKAKLDIFWYETRIGFDKYKNKIWTDILLEEKYIKTILEWMIQNIDIIYKRQDFIDFLLNNWNLTNLISLYNKWFFLKNYELWKKWKTIYINNWTEFISSDKYLWKILILELLKEESIDDILSIMNSDEKRKRLMQAQVSWEIRLPKFMIINLYDFRKSIISIIEFNNYLKQNFSDNKLIKSQIIFFDKYIDDFNLDRDFREILLDMKDKKGYIESLSQNIDNILKEWIKLWSILKISKFVEDFKMNKVSFNEDEEQYYKWWYSIYPDLEDNVKADSLDDNTLNIFRAPNGIWKTFYIEKDIYIRIFAQSIWYSTVEKWNFRRYNSIISANRMQSQSENDDDLSALWIEWKRLDEIYSQIEQNNWNIILTLDETGSTTDEKNQFKIIKDFIESIEKLQNWRIITIRLSTHNQLLINYFKENKNIDVWIYTFNKKRELYKWERDSDTINSFKSLLNRIWDKDLICIWKSLIVKLEEFFEGNIKKYEVDKWLSKISYKPIEYTEKEKEEMYKHIKWFDETLYKFSSYSDYIKDCYIDKGTIKNIVRPSFHGEDFFSYLTKEFANKNCAFYSEWENIVIERDYNTPIEKDFEWEKWEKYKYFPMYFSNSNLNIPLYSADSSSWKINLNIILGQIHISDIRLVKERQKMILDFKNHIQDSLFWDSLDGLESSINYTKEYIDFIKWFLEWDLYFSQSKKNTINQRKQTIYIDEEWIQYYPYQRRQENIVLNIYNSLLNDIDKLFWKIINYTEQIIKANWDFSELDLYYNYDEINSQVDFLNFYSTVIINIFQTNISSIDWLMYYLNNFHNILLEKNELGYLEIWETCSLKWQIIYNNHIDIWYVNNDYPWINFSGILNDITWDFKNFLWLINYAKFLKEYSFTDVNFTQEKKLEIINMKWWDVENKNIVWNDVNLDFENPIEIINWFNSSWKTEYIKNILLTLNSAFNYGFVNADSMTIWGVHSFAYIDRIVVWNNNYSSWEQDLLYWLKLFKEIEDKDFVIINVDEIFTTMDIKYSTAFAYNFVWKLLEDWKFAIIISHNHEFVELISKLKWVKINRFDSKIDKKGNVEHTYKKISWAIKDSAWVEVLKNIWIGDNWLKK